MMKNNGDFSPQELARLLRQPQAQAILAKLQAMDRETLRQAASHAQQGDLEQAKQMLQPLLDDSQVQRLSQQIRGSDGGI